MSHQVDFEPVGRRVECNSGESLLEAARHAGIVLNATCGGEGLCGRCLVRLMEGMVSAPSITEQEEVGQERIGQGWRLACQAKALGEVRVHIPPESLATAQRTQIEGQEQPHELSPAVRSVDVSLAPPNLEDLRSDAACLREALGSEDVLIPLPVLQNLSDDLRVQNYAASVFLRDNCVAGVRPVSTAALGLAVDIGTTKLAGYLVDLDSGKTLAALGAMNPQIAFGEDVMARISHAMNKAEGREDLRLAIIKAVNDLAGGLCNLTGRMVEDIADAVVVGNTAMHHLFLGLSVRQLGMAPYVPAESTALDIPAHDLGLELAAGANVHLLPNIAGFVGADHVAMLLGSGMLERSGVILGMDIGTNTEISLMAHGRHYACSTASGPAFEGAHIRHGMRAAPGAIEKVLIKEDKVLYQTIGGVLPVGLCGSGILDLVAQMRLAGVLDGRGIFERHRTHARLRRGEHGAEFIVAPAEETEGAEITFNRKDVSEIQLAKGAMRAGTQVLLQKAGVEERDIDEVMIAGAFGTYLDVQSGMDIGMFPRLERNKFTQVGNAAGSGARLALLSTGVREQAARVARQVSYVELTAEKEFTLIFTRALALE
jgi:uncharacterized 2Fe-2S/4Fe-4S cluster protein (DUF4445 family)